jgi:hypothetical protein
MHSHSTDILKKSYKILAISAALFLFGGGALLWDKVQPRTEVRQPEYHAPLSLEPAPDGKNPARQASAIKNYPAPSTFHHFAYSESEIRTENTLHFGGTCSDELFTTLVFRSDIDYRADPSSAVINRAYPCPKSKSVSIDLLFSDLRGFHDGEYYAIVADQGNKGVWYNPR